MARRRPTGARHYPRTARLNELLREIVAEQVERADLDGIGLITITGVNVDNELTLARVYFSSFDDEADVIDALHEIRTRLKAAIGREARIRRVPELVFENDGGIRHGGRVDEILRELYPDGLNDEEE